MALAHRVARLEAIPDEVPVPDQRDSYAMRLFAEGVVAADRWEGQRRFAALMWAKRARPDMEAAALKGYSAAVEAAFATGTETERRGMRAAFEVLLRFLEAQAGDGDGRCAPGPLLA